MNSRQRLHFETLEARRLLAADLIAADIYLRDYQGNRVESAPIGEQIEVVAEWDTQDLVAGTTYDLKFKVNEFELIIEDVVQGAGQASFEASLAQMGWYAFEGTNRISFELDPANELAEASDANNQFYRTFEADIPSPPSTFRWPLADRQFEVYGVSSYNDVDPSERRLDYLGRTVGADNHWGWDVSPAIGFDPGDRGMEILAAAKGTVSWAGDGYFDRITMLTGLPSNGVVIDHGNGWTSLYVHMRRDGVLVEVGDVVKAGDLIGLMGSSGNSTRVHLHYHISRHGRAIDPIIGRSHYLEQDFSDRFSQIVVKELGITNYETLTDFRETISSTRVFPQSPNTIYFAMDGIGKLRSDAIELSIYRPSGQLWLTHEITSELDIGHGIWLPRWILPSIPELGRWRVTYEARGQLIGEDFFEISNEGVPELRMEHDGTMVTEARWTPYEFAAAARGNASPTLTFTIENHGTATLEIHEIELPEWVTLTRSPPASLQAGASTTFEIAASTAEAGIRWGQVAVLTNDASERRSTFQVESIIRDGALGATRVGLAFQHALEGQTVAAKVYRTFVDASPVVVDLSTTHPHRLSVPQQVVIPAGERWAMFDVQVQDDQEAQELTRTEVIASPNRGFLASHSELLIVDNDRVHPEVMLEFPTGEVAEDSGTVLGLVSRSGDLRDELPVQLWVTDSSQIRTPLWVTIPAFRESAEFRLTAIDNSLADGARLAEVTASVFGVTSDRASVLIIDDETDRPPTDLSVTPNSISENSPPNSLVGQLSTVDPDPSDEFAYVLVSGNGSDHNSDFRIDGQRLLATTVFDYEATTQRRIRVRTTDLSGNSIEKQLTINVTDANEFPNSLGLDGDVIKENLAQGTHIGWLRVQDPDNDDTHSFSLVSGEGDRDNVRFQVVGNSLRTRERLNFETQPIHSIRVRGTDSGGLFVERIFEITVEDVAEAPTDVFISPDAIPENSESGVLVGRLTSIDEDNANSFTYRFVDGVGDTDNEHFRIVRDELFALKSFDHEDRDTRTIRIETSDNTGLTFARSLLVSILDVNEEPTEIELGVSSIPENQPIGTLLSELSTVDADSDESFSYLLVSGEGSEGNASFSIGEGGNLFTAVRFDHEAQSQYNIRVRSTDSGGLSVEKTFVIEITDAGEPPTDIVLDNNSIAENQPIGTLVGGLSAVDPDAGDSAAFTLVAGTGDTNNGQFSIVGNELRSAAVFDFETQSSYSVRVRATDSTGLTFEKVFTLAVLDENESPTDVTLSPDVVDENSGVGTSVGNFSALDPDAGDSFTYTLVAGSGDTDNAGFTIEGDVLKTAASFDYEEQPTRSIRVEATDSGGLKFSKSILVNIGDVNESPTDVSLSNNRIAENQPVGTLVGELSAIDPDLADEFVFSLLDNANASEAFTLVGRELRTAQLLDFESTDEFVLTIRATDLGGLSFEKEIRVEVGDANDAPREIWLSENSVLENQPVGTLVGVLSAADQDASDEFSYSLVAGVGDVDNESFLIESNQLTTNESFDFETESTRRIRIAVEDTAGAVFEQEFIISIIDEDEFQREDVNADLFVSPIDALLVINHLNSSSGGELGPDVNPRLDVNGDQFVSPIDALIVINYLNRHASGEAEQSLTFDEYFAQFPFDLFERKEKWREVGASFESDSLLSKLLLAAV